ncbi:PHB depolymerase family esterase [Chitinophaga sp. sic0106]|uniref:alpha/beta hydrolase family esterase n=1 Tax=Chitinophaga sp. sic0106 TaxID=2854785 RepID=UPI001C46FE64|nr:hypothetical protein [Chitinophaga sp. sic0106]MBV7533017.1 hypothetical protein [Chitinophaga sp. sic0106]
MKQYICMLAIASGLWACTKDTSVYAPQKKENVQPAELFQPDGPEKTPDGFLRAGINKVVMEVAMPDGTTMKREFKYYFPISLNPNKPISLVFNFHGSYTYATGTPPPDPILYISATDPLNRLADTANIITVWPAGAAEPGAVNWAVSEKHIPFVKAMVTYFKGATPTVDANRIYTCGHSSGAIFSFVLAREMNDVFAAACPVSGQMKLTDLTAPARTTAVRAFNGQKDATVKHSAAVSNINVWADVMGGYYAKDSIVGQKVITAGNYTLLPTKWGGGNGSVEFFSIPEADHGIDWSIILPYMWEFMRNNPLNKPTGPYIGVVANALGFSAGKQVSVPMKTSRNTVARVVSAPDGFTVTLTEGMVNIATLPTALSGKIVLEGALDGKTQLVEINMTKK